MAHAEIDTGVDGDQAIEQGGLESQQSECPRRVRTAALEQGADTQTAQFQFALPEPEVNAQTGRALQHCIQLAHRVEVVLAHVVVALARLPLGVKQGHIETEGGHHIHIEEQLVLDAGLIGHTHRETAGIGKRGRVLVLVLQTLSLTLHRGGGTAVDLLARGASKEELVHLGIQFWQMVFETVTRKEIEGEIGSGFKHHQVGPHTELHTFALRRLSDAEIPFSTRFFP